MSGALELFLNYPFAQRALLAGVMVALLGALVGFFVVLRRMAFVAAGISHAALGGVALGVLFGQSPTLWAIGFTIAVALLMSVLARRGVSEDTAMGIFFPSAMAFGVVVIGLSPVWRQDLMSYLFGDILAVQPADLWSLAITTALTAGLVALFFRELLFISFDEESAHAAGVPVAPFRTLLVVLMAVTVVVAIKVVGVVLVSAMLVIPTASAAQLTSRWQGILLGSLAVALASLLSGLWVSFTWRVSTGPGTVLVAAALFALASVVGWWRARRANRVPAMGGIDDALRAVEA